MSKMPNIEQINQLRGHVYTLARAKKDIVDYQHRIQKYRDLLKLREETHARCQHEIVKLMDDMDVSAIGNFGWENRFMSFIAELVCPFPGNENKEEISSGG